MICTRSKTGIGALFLRCLLGREYRHGLIYLLTAVCVYGSLFAATAPPNFVWANKSGGTGSDWGWGTAVDGFGNVFVAGKFNGSASFGITNVSGAGADDVYIAKYDVVGTLKWVRSAGGTGTDQGFGVGIDGAGNVFVSGMFQGTATFGNTNLISAGAGDIFLAKYSTDGAFQWVRQAGGAQDDMSTAAVVDFLGNVFITGYFTGTASFGAAQILFCKSFYH